MNKNIFPQFALLISAVGMVFSNSVIAQDFSYANISAQAATFTGGNLPIRRDEGGSFYGPPHWDVDNVDQVPVAYKSGDAPRVNATFKMECENVPDSIWMRGVGPEGMTFAPRIIAVEPAGDTYSIYYPSTTSDLAF